MKNIDGIFSPSSVAIVGATRTPGTVPHDILMNILRSGYQGVVYPVCPRVRSIGGVRTYKYVIDIPDPVELAVLVFPSEVCHLAMEQCGQKGVKSCIIIIIIAGFREVGAAGLEREARVKEIAVFGPVVMFGLGGTFVEVFRDVTFRAAPLGRHDVDDSARDADFDEVRGVYDENAFVQGLRQESEELTERAERILARLG